ncbi:MAG: carboxypeptidase regulatory-like domain-containing protein [Proteobacteria bacterium]|nr:carboxypeptidase regulatory-like domain-containing protein [Pseudomonadota bacterium]
MTAEAIIALVIAAAAFLACVRLWLRQRRAPGPRWRLAVLLLAQPLCAALLYFALLPPRMGVQQNRDTLVVLTAGSAPAQFDRAEGQADAVIALPEAPPALAARGERQPDLATALRAHPEAGRLQVLGDGLVARDHGAVAGRTLAFDESAPTRGLLQLDHPRVLVPGQAFRINGQARDVATVALLDPAGEKIANATPGKEGRFQLEGHARTAGPTVFRLQSLDGSGRVVERASVPLNVITPRAPHVLLIAAAPNAETKYLRRWAEDTGVELQTRIELGGGIRVGDAVALDEATLRRLDLLVLDERSLDNLGSGGRARLHRAVGDGLGVLVRLDGEPPASTREQLGALGLPASSDEAPLLRADGKPLGWWAAAGRGRVGAWLLPDAWQWVLQGDATRHGEAWSQAFATLARADADASMAASIEPRVGERSAICPLSSPASVTAPDNTTTSLLRDGSCAAFWPRVAGWHWLHRGNGAQAFFVRAIDDAPGLAREQLRSATRALASAGASANTRKMVAASAPRGPSWPWWLAWLACSVALWWFERRLLATPASEV